MPHHHAKVRQQATESKMNDQQLSSDDDAVSLHDNEQRIRIMAQQEIANLGRLRGKVEDVVDRFVEAGEVRVFVGLTGLRTDAVDATLWAKTISGLIGELEVRVPIPGKAKR